MSDDEDAGLDAGHGRSPGATGRLFPDAKLVTPASGLFSLDRYRPLRNLVVLMLGSGPIVAPTARLLRQLAVAHVEIEAEDGQIVVIAANTPAQWRAGWPYAFPLAFDVGATLHRRMAAVDSAGRPDVALFITDRFREIFAVLRPRDARWPTSARDVIEWLTFINIQCPECNPPEA
ncbi:hypothetical protein J421_5671 (plasmid) [Gemmatirosa kalamazoonensis]|uniref:Alkyl hydroperoxide reductase subunit C/ Thiol specific antioxidant domain-containing protein n=2 Tax=Gemmatirosa kalamazoonensis TaxID=861299 RepID=W0RRA5_9BACT|nr:hypothetical protein J421_5671 [Gemmatirosa kalamazoonensis]